MEMPKTDGVTVEHKMLSVLHSPVPIYIEAKIKYQNGNSNKLEWTHLLLSTVTTEGVPKRCLKYLLSDNVLVTYICVNGFKGVHCTLISGDVYFPFSQNVIEYLQCKNFIWQHKYV